jgi:uncharacterized membrane protein YphA (DoxX/SURF4 family)
MLNIFPNLLTYSLFAPLLLRLALGVFLILTSHKALSEQKIPWVNGNKIQNISRGATIVLVVSGIFILIGLFTQVVALLVFIINSATLTYKWRIKKSISNNEIALYSFIIIIALSLMVSGAGFYAIDLPL